MLIRCEKCSTLYELDDKLIPAGGAPVQCTKCQFVFRAYPTPPAETLNGVPAGPTQTPTPSGTPVPTAPSTAAASEPAAPPPPQPAALPPPPAARPSSGRTTLSGLADASAEPLRSSPALRAPASGPAPENKFTADGRPIRKVPFPDDASREAGEAARPSLARPTVRAIPVKPRPTRPAWLVPAAVALALVLALAVAFAAWRLLARGKEEDPRAAQRRTQGQSLLLRDDAQSLAAAAVAFEEAARLDPRLLAARADRALAHALVLGLVQGEAARLEDRLAAQQGEAARAAPAPGSAPPAPGPDPLEAARAQRDAVRGRALRLEAEVEAELAPLVRSQPDDLTVRRARAMLDAVAGDAGRARAALARDGALRGKDPWLDLALATAEVRAESPERRAEGAARLDALAAANPAMLRASLIAAQAHAQAGRAGPAVAALDALLAADPENALALELKAEVLAPPPVRPVEVAVAPAAAPPRGREGPLPKKEDSQARADAGR